MALDAQIAFRTSSEVKAMLEDIAASQNKRFSQLLNEIIVDYAKRHKGKDVSSMEAILHKLEEHEQLIAQLQQAQLEMVKK
ncbi:hypothetical protein NIES4071_106120 (plasmid) [Calothrix sp. NIES-4071]|nr:hypothetical protein NIES4071_106120 [Calothrix sp. NIES-4071]BAZ65030.1 hypothetical protein NIES4105_107630 [Calothrix sp. NIES-4105]